MTKLTQVVLELAREPGHPHGDRDHGYHLNLPLDDSGLIDQQAYEHLARACTVKCYRPHEAARNGKVRHSHGQWIFDYDDRQEFDDETGFRLEAERFVPGEYISIRESDGVMHTFQIISVRPWA